MVCLDVLWIFAGSCCCIFLYCRSCFYFVIVKLIFGEQRVGQVKGSRLVSSTFRSWRVGRAVMIVRAICGARIIADLLKKSNMIGVADAFVFTRL